MVIHNHKQPTTFINSDRLGVLLIYPREVSVEAAVLPLKLSTHMWPIILLLFLTIC